jgi:hypothetical protein
LLNSSFFFADAHFRAGSVELETSECLLRQREMK